MEETDESHFLQLPSEGSAPTIGYSPEDILTNYKYDSSPRGFALIMRRVLTEFSSYPKQWFISLLSNEDFQASSYLRPRKGDEVDVDNLTELFEVLGLEVSVLKNVSKKEMLDSLGQFREKFL